MRVGRVQAGDGAVRRCCSFDGHRRRGRCGCARSWPSWLIGCSGLAALWRRSRRFHRRRRHGCLRRASGVGGPRYSCLHGGPRCQGRGEAGCRDVQDRDGVDLLLRVGLNSGQVIAGEIGSGPFGYTAIGEQVGMAQRMESVAPPGGVMLSASTARLVDDAATLGMAVSLD